MTGKIATFTTNNILPSAVYQVLMDMGFKPNEIVISYDNLIVTAEVPHWILGTIGILVDCRTAFKGGFSLVKLKSAHVSDVGEELPY